MAPPNPKAAELTVTQPTPSPEPGERKTFAEIGNWEISSTTYKRCMATAVFENEEGIVLEFDAATKTVTVAFSEKNSTSLKQGDKRTLNVFFLKNGKLDDGWEDTEFTAHVMSDGVRMLFSESLQSTFLDDFAKGSKIGFFIGGEPIETYVLTGTSRVVKALKSCAMKAAGINPLDPFAK